VPNLTPHESLLLQLAQEHLKKPAAGAAGTFDGELFSAGARNLATDGSARLEREWPSKVRMVATSQPLLPPTIASGVLETVSEALYGNRWLNLDYENAGGCRQPVQVMPLGLVQQGPRLYLVCRYRGFDNERNLALHRIRRRRWRP